MVAGHIVMGATIYQATGDKPRWLKWLLIIMGGFASHWVLDSVVSYHWLSLPFGWHGYLIILANTLAIVLLWYLAGRHLSQWWRKLLPPQMIAGLIAWLSWDFEWLIADGQWLHQSYHPILMRYFPTQSLEPISALLEVCFVWIFFFVAIPIGVKKLPREGKV